MWWIHIVVWKLLLLGKKLRFILSDRSDFHMTDNLSKAVHHAFASCELMSFSVDEKLLPRLVNLSTSFKEPPVRVEMSHVWFWLKHMYSVLSALTWRPIPPAAFSRLCSWNSAWECICQKRYVISVVHVRNNLYTVLSASCLFQCRAILFY